MNPFRSAIAILALALATASCRGPDDGLDDDPLGDFIESDDDDTGATKNPQDDDDDDSAGDDDDSAGDDDDSAIGGGDGKTES